MTVFCGGFPPKHDLFLKAMYLLKCEYLFFNSNSNAETGRRSRVKKNWSSVSGNHVEPVPGKSVGADRGTATDVAVEITGTELYRNSTESDTIACGRDRCGSSVNAL